MMQPISLVVFILIGIAHTSLVPPAIGGKELKSLSLHQAEQRTLLSKRGTNPGYEDSAAMPGDKFIEPYNIDPKRCPSGFWRVGCFMDSQQLRKVVPHVHYKDIVAKEDRVPMTPQVCYDFCKNVSGSQFMGLEHGFECFCTPWFEQSTGGHGECDNPCEGDTKAMCGGNMMVDVYELHDCNNLPAQPCKKPPADIEFAKAFHSKAWKTESICKNAKNLYLTTVDAMCEVECIKGYEVKKNTLECTEMGDRLTYAWAQMTGMAICGPVVCGKPPYVKYAKFPKAVAVFNNFIPYTCKLGHSTNAKASGPTLFDVECQWDATFSTPEACPPVECGNCPSAKDKYAHMIARETAMRVYETSCTFDCNEGYTLTATAGAKSVFTIDCLATGEFAEPMECLPVICGPVLDVPHSTPDEEDIPKDDLPLVFPNTVGYKCKEGYSLTGEFGGETKFTTECTSAGLFSPPLSRMERWCMPVSCGVPEVVKHALWLNAEVFYTETVTYGCLIGYTLSGEAGGKAFKTLTCNAFGKFDDPYPVCKPVICGEPPSVDLASTERPGKVYFDEPPVDYNCDPGYSTDITDSPYEPLSANFSLICMETGSFSEPVPECVNIDDCLFHGCGDDGVCRDIRKPTGVPHDDYTCDCSDGYEITLHKSTSKPAAWGVMEKICTNINDCPVPLDENCGTLKRGTCKDGLNSYRCSCFSGYQEEVLKDGNSTCVPVVCGVPSEVKHATTEVHDEVDFDSPPVGYICDKGYTTDGLPKTGPNDGFEIKCKNSAVFSPPGDCVPVVCGNFPDVKNSVMSPAKETFVFPEVAKYTCDEGYSLDGEASGEKAFDVECLASGQHTEKKECKPVMCGTPKPQDHTEHMNVQEVKVFTDIAVIECEPGYSTDQTTNPESESYPRACKADGTFTEEIECKPVECLEPPEVTDTKRPDGKTVFKDIVKYALDEGYTMDCCDGCKGKPVKEPTFTIECQADATYSKGQEVCPVNCGYCPHREKATCPEEMYVFQEKALYTCLKGFSTEGDYKSDNTFELECQADATYPENPKGCKPNSCGKTTEPEHSEQTSKFAELVYMDGPKFECLPGYSLNGRMAGKTTFSTVCQYDGTQSEHPGCKNKDDCEGNQCGPNGKCVDHEKPTGKHEDDYNCKCDSGFKEKILEDGTKVCENKNDCPKGACLPGRCHDLVNDFECECPEGFFVDDKGHACSPENCGVPPPVPHAKTPVRTVMYYTSKPADYDCDTGYTMDGSARGVAEFDLECLATGKFEDPPPCKPVVCGKAPQVKHAELKDPNTYTYGMKAMYKCEPGYWIASTKKFWFSGLCTETSEFRGIEMCTPRPCPPVNPQKSALYDERKSKSMVYPQKLDVFCIPGYALDKHDRSLTEYQISCEAGGGLAKHPKSSNCKPIDCGPLPEVPNAKISGSTRFGGQVDGKCKYGYTLTGHAGGEEQFTMTCMKGGKYSKAPKCKRVSCGPPPEISFAHDPKIKTWEEADDSGKEREAFYNDLVTFECLDGYRVDANNDGMADVTEFKTSILRCKANGVTTSTRKYGQQDCLPIVCPIPKMAQHRYPFFSRKTAGGPVTFNEDQNFVCTAGYSVGGTPSDATSFFEVCQDDGQFSEKKKCEDIDYCLIGRCGKHGKCLDSTFTYWCECDEGYKVVPDNEGYDVCEEIDECDTMDGNELCASKGTCKDLLLKYECMCDEGYHNEDSPEGLDTCEPVCCGTPDKYDHAITRWRNTKVHFPDAATYFCDVGYTVDGTVEGDFSFDVSCDADKKFTNGEGCKPIDCGSVVEVDHATSDVTDLKYPESATYTCDEGYTLSGEAKSTAEFTVQCTAAGAITETAECLPVSCGEPPAVAFAVYQTNHVTYKDKSKYECIGCYTTTGEAGGDTKFDLECGKDGKYSKAEKCMPISCGTPEKMKHALVPMQEYTCGQNYQVICHAGYTLGGGPDAESTFIVSCGGEGTFGIKKGEKCEPVKCPKPKDLPGAKTTDGVKVYKEEATWTCKDGYSLSGREGGPTELRKMCMADGNYGDSSPSDCPDINFCIGGPCGKNGFCTDLGPGKVNPGYNCTCNEGYEVKKDGDKETCSKDDCNPDPCGEGGTCIDLSKQDPPGPEGQYSCECQEGYSLVVKERGPPQTFTCERNTCGPVPTIEHMAEDGLELRLYEPPADRKDDTLTGQPILLSFDTATFTCEDGYSTDGTVSRESRAFTLECEAGGVWSRTLEPGQECQPVRCDSFQLPAVPFTHITDPKENFYEYPESVGFKCWNGYTLTGEVDGAVSFDIKCTAEGDFEEFKEDCTRITCGRPSPHRHSRRSSRKKAYYGDSVIYSCDEGYTIDGSGSGAHGYVGTCNADGKVAFSAGDKELQVEDRGICQVVTCGAPPSLVGYSASFDKETATTREITAMDPDAQAICKDGYTVGGAQGGDPHFFVHCGGDGHYSGFAKCEGVQYTVSGEVTDVTSAYIKIDGAKVEFSENGVSMGSAYTNSMGRYSITVSMGTYTITASKVGYVTASKKSVQVTGPIQVGQGADMSMTEPLAPGQWRVVVNWGQHSEDLDSHSYFGDQETTHVYWPSYHRGPKTAPGTSGITVKLDRDDTDGEGPETTTFEGVGDCKERGKCLIKFKVKNYSSWDSTNLGDSKVKIHLYEGSTGESDYAIPTSVGDDLWHTVFTIDARTAKAYPGEWHDAPYADNIHTVNWYQSMNYNTWSHTDPDSIMIGFFKAAVGDASKISMAKSASIRMSTGISCEQREFDFSGDAEKWGSCLDGTYADGFLPTGTGTLAGISCCTIGGLPLEYGACVDTPIDSEGWTDCNAEDDGADPYYVAGIHRNAAGALDTVKCCKFPGEGLMEGAAP